MYKRIPPPTPGKQLGMTSHENATPIRVVHNAAGHLGGAARPLGGIVVGYLGVRSFAPQPVSQSIQTVGKQLNLSQFLKGYLDPDPMILPSWIQHENLVCNV